MTTQEQALEWFSKLGLKQYNLIEKYNLKPEHQFTPQFKREIEEIWKQELQEASAAFEYKVMDDGSNYPKEPQFNFNSSCRDEDHSASWGFGNKQPQVDFEMLNFTISHIMVDPTLNREPKDNLFLFFNLLATKPTFAQRAYKELNKLI